MARNFGDRNKNGYRHSAASLTQRELAAVKSLEARKVVEDDTLRKQGQVKTKILDGYTKLKKLKKLTNCDTCAAKTYCPMYIELVNETDSKSRMKCPMWNVYRSSIVDVTQNPLMYLAKKAADLDIAIAQQKMKDMGEGIAISKEMLAATKVALEAVKIAEKAQDRLSKRGKYGKQVYDASIDDDAALDVDFTLPEE